MGDLREINLELGRPGVREAIRSLRQELNNSRSLHYAAVKLIHGYGSTGPGGKIRTAVRRELARMLEQGQVHAIIPGERLSIFDAQTRMAFSRCDALRRDADLERYNNGITVVVL